MKCAQARRLFGGYWDDDTTQAEREWLESHFGGCAACRKEYEEYSRTLEWVGALPRVEPAPNLVERTLSRARRAVPAPDHMPVPGIQWVPVTAAAALLLVMATLISPWLGLGPGPRVASRSPERSSVPEAQLVPAAPAPSPSTVAGVDPVRVPVAGAKSGSEPLAAVPDSLFDHNEDVEFILDPVTLRRGRASLTRAPAGPQAERAVITF